MIGCCRQLKTKASFWDTQCCRLPALRWFDFCNVNVGRGLAYFPPWVESMNSVAPSLRCLENSSIFCVFLNVFLLQHTSTITAEYKTLLAKISLRGICKFGKGSSPFKGRESLFTMKIHFNCRKNKLLFKDVIQIKLCLDPLKIQNKVRQFHKKTS